jgi:hypothetical protein
MVAHKDRAEEACRSRQSVFISLGWRVSTLGILRKDERVWMVGFFANSVGIWGAGGGGGNGEVGIGVLELCTGDTNEAFLKSWILSL